MQHTITLKHGLKPAKERHTECVLREPSAGDIFDAQDAAERLVMTPNGPALVLSEVRLGNEMSRRQIVRIGGIEGNPLQESHFRDLHPEDLKAIEVALDDMDSIAGKELSAERGRDKGVGDSD